MSDNNRKRKRDITEEKRTSKKRQKTKLELIWLSDERCKFKRCKFNGRPEWSTSAKNIITNQTPSEGELEDRRHLLHWDEILKPLLERVFTAMKREYSEKKLYDKLKEPLRGWKQLGTTPDAIMKRIAKEINGAVINLVPDRADINNAIEHVRANLRKYAERLKNDSNFAKEIIQDPTNNNRMDHYKKAANEFFPVDDHEKTPILSRKSEIHAMILEDINGCTAPCNLWQLLHDLTYSVTFDLSHKANKEKTSAVLAWQKTMRANFELPAEDQYRDLLSLLK